MSEEERVKFGLSDSISPELFIKNTIKEIVEGDATDKKEVWERLQKGTGLPDSKLLKQLNFYLKLESLPTFNRLLLD